LKHTDLPTCSNDSEFSSSSVPSQSIAAITSGVESIQFDLERDLNRQLTRERRERRATLTEQDLNETFDSSIVFSDSGSGKRSSNSRKADDQDESPEEVKSMFVKPGDDSDSTDEETDDVEEVPRSEVGKLLAKEVEIKEDFILFIKMAPYPLTLEEFIVSIFSIDSLELRELTVPVARSTHHRQRLDD
jgi:translation initiation factor 2-alpha kinase 3